MLSVAKATGRLTMSATAAATGLSEFASSGPPLGRPKWASRMTLPPLSAISTIVGATRSMRVASVTRPFSVGTLRSTRRSTRLPAKSASSSVRNGLLISASCQAEIRPTKLCSRHPEVDPSGRRFWGVSRERSLDVLRHRNRSVRHAARETPFVVVPGKYARKFAVDHLGLVQMEDRRAVVVVEIARDVGLIGIA